MKKILDKIEWELKLFETKIIIFKHQLKVSILNKVFCRLGLHYTTKKSRSWKKGSAKRWTKIDYKACKGCNSLFFKTAWQKKVFLNERKANAKFMQKYFESIGENCATKKTKKSRKSGKTSKNSRQSRK